MEKPVIYFHDLAIQTDSLLTACTVSGIVHGSMNGVRGTVEINGQSIKWSTIQQYEYHNGFEIKNAMS